MLLFKNLKINTGIVLILGLLLFIYLILRAIYVPLVHDEVATFFHYIHMGRYLPFDAHWDANNHMLNSFLSIIFYQLFGSSEVVLRMANLLSFPVYLYFIYRISQSLSWKLMRWAFILATCFAHGFMEFFAYTRGYGISMALLAGAIWYLFQVFKTNRLKYYVLSLVFIFFAQTANLTLVNTAIIIITLLLFKALLSVQTEKLLTTLFRFIVVIFLGMAPLVIFTYLSFILKEKNLLYYGASTGFWDITVNSQLEFIFSLNSGVAGVLVIIIFIISVLIFLFVAFKKPAIKSFDDPHFIFFYLLIANIVATFLLNLIFKVNYPADRTGMYLYFYLFSAFIFLVDRIKFKSQLLILILMLPMLLVPLDFIFSINLSRAAIWPIDKIPQRYYDKINESYDPEAYPPTIGGYHLRHFCWSYLCFKDGGHYPQIFSSGYPGLETDYQIARAEEIAGWRTYYDSLDYDRTSGLYLIKRKTSLSKELLLSTKVGPLKIPDSIGFVGFYEGECSKLAGKTIYFTIDMQILSPATPLRAWIVAEAVTQQHKTLRYEFLALDWLKSSWCAGRSHLMNVMLMDNIPEEAWKLKVYLWNIDRVHIEISGGSIGFYELKLDYPLPDKAGRIIP